MTTFADLSSQMQACLPGIFDLAIPYLDDTTLAAAARVNSEAFRLATTELWRTAPQYVVETVKEDNRFTLACRNKVRTVDGSRNNTTSLPLLPSIEKINALRAQCPHMTSFHCTGSSQPIGFRRPGIDITFDPSPSSSVAAQPTGRIRRCMLDHWYYICSPRELDLPTEKAWPGFDAETEYGVAIYKPQDAKAVRRWLLDAPGMDARIYRLDLLQGVQASLADIGEVCAARRKLGKRPIEELQISAGRGGELEALVKGAGAELRALIIELDGELADVPGLLELVKRGLPGLKALTVTMRSSSRKSSGLVEEEEEFEAYAAREAAAEVLELAKEESKVEIEDRTEVAMPAPQLEHLTIALPDIKCTSVGSDETILQEIAARARDIAAKQCAIRLHGGCEGVLPHQTRFAEIIASI